MASVRRARWRGLLLIGVLLAALWATIAWKRWEPVLGLDLQGGLSIVLCPKGEQPDQCGTADPGSIEQAREIIANRVDALGVAEPDITRRESSIEVQIAGLKEQDQDRAFKLIGTTAKLRFRPVLGAVPEPPKRGVIPDCARPDTWPRDDPLKEIVLCLRQTDPRTGDDLPKSQWPRLRLAPARLEGEDVADAQAIAPLGTNVNWEVALELGKAGARKFQTVTGELACNQGERRQLAIVLDRVIESAPQMSQDPPDPVDCNVGIEGGEARITGTFTDREAKDLSLVLRYGALPVELTVETITTVSATLGRESLRNGMLAALIGVAIVFLYVLFFYRALGLIIWAGLGLHAAVTVGVIIILGQTAGFTLSLAGIAGLIVSLGIAADSFIVYFERIKDEVLGGRTLRAAVDRAWPSARRTIVAADLVTALAAVVLYFLAVGNVRGFALMLGLATSLDLFISFWFMHPSVWQLAQTRFLAESKTLGMRAVGGGALAAGETRA